MPRGKTFTDPLVDLKLLADFNRVLPVQALAKRAAQLIVARVKFLEENEGKLTPQQEQSIRDSVRRLANAIEAKVKDREALVRDMAVKVDDYVRDNS